ncbi:MAG: 4-alpha-glucanotransferase, partial [Pseudomonadota bacterium]
MNPPPSPLHERRAGVLLHPTSLPSALGKGDLGPHAYRFVEFLAAGGMGVWQVLPLSPPHDDDSPYHCLSTSAGNPLLISPELLVEQGWLDAADYDIACAAHNPGTARRALLAKARQGFLNSASAAEHEALSAFIAQHAYWLEDYALFQALRETYH